VKQSSPFLFLFILLFFSAANALEKEAQREAIVTPRSKRFYPRQQAKQYISFGGIYNSDYNSKQYQLNSRYLYQSNKMVNEMNFDHETRYADSGSGSKKKYRAKDRELYDLALSAKIKIGETNNYLVGYHRSIYDEFSNYTYDVRNAVGVGRAFFDGAFELDASLGYRDVKSEGEKMDFITSWRSNFKITEKLTFIQRAYLFLDNESVDNQFRSSLLYRIGERLSLELRHNFEQRRYENNAQNDVENFVNRSITIGLTFDLN